MELKKEEGWSRSWSTWKRQAANNACWKPWRTWPSAGGQAGRKGKACPSLLEASRVHRATGSPPQLKASTACLALVVSPDRSGFVMGEHRGRKQLWVCGLPGCSRSPLNASLGPLCLQPFICRVSSDSHWVYSVIRFVNCCPPGTVPLISPSSIPLFVLSQT